MGEPALEALRGPHYQDRHRTNSTYLNNKGHLQGAPVQEETAIGPAVLPTL